jgi:hypothetical protein
MIDREARLDDTFFQLLGRKHPHERQQAEKSSDGCNVLDEAQRCSAQTGGAAHEYTVSAFPVAISIILDDTSMAVICSTNGEWAIAVEPVPQPNANTFMSGRKYSRVSCSFFITRLIRDRLFRIPGRYSVPELM